MTPLRLIMLAPTLVATAFAHGLERSIAPFTSEAGGRGLVFAMDGYPTSTDFHGSGCGFADLDGDDDADVILLGGVGDAVGIFANLGDGEFTDRSYACGIPPLSGLSGFATADFDGDGLVDIVISRVLGPTKLYRNLGGFQFIDATTAAGITTERITKGVACGDFDGDGWVDIYLCNFIATPADPEAGRNQLYRNLGDGTFEEMGAELGVDGKGMSFQAVWTDIDRDGDLDLYLSNDRGYLPLFGPNRLWRNDGGFLTEIGSAAGAGVALNSMGLACGDFNGDGFTDFYCTNTPQSPPPISGQNPLLLSTQETTFVQAQVAWAVGAPSTSFGWGCTFLDFDNDGNLDLYVVNASSPNRLYRHTGVPPAEDVAEQADIAGLVGDWTIASYGIACADVNGDGAPDLLLNPQNAAVSLHINHEGLKRRWLVLRVVGEWPNTAAIGANAEIAFASAGANRTAFREIYAGGNGYLGQNEQVLHFGLDQATHASAIVRWPSGGPIRTLTNIPADHRWTILPPSMLGDADRSGQLEFAERLAQCAALGAVALGTELFDFDGDFVIGAADRSAFRDRFEEEGGLWADIDGSGTVGGADLAILLGAWGSGDCLADLDGDGIVGGADLATLLGAWTGG